MKEMNTAANHSSLFTGSFSKPGLCLSGLWRRGGKPVTRPGRRVLLLSLHVEKDLALSFLEDLHSTLTYSPDCETEKHDYTARSFPLGRNNDVQRKGSICFEGNLLCSFPALYV